ncbi:MAG: Do family serine endopeptidase [Candidatus Riflebacteria bacterium]|nr:Do family serine endopeptidase [Candidatus Riflebacteria bacterium]
MKFSKSIAILLISLVFSYSFNLPVFAEDDALKAALSMQKAFINVAKKLKPAVVNISTEKVVSQGKTLSYDDETYDFLKKFFNMPGFKGQQEEPKIQGAGSGVIISSDGVIVTNNHVVKGATKIIVKTYDEEKYEAKIIGQDPQTDLAVIKVEAEKPLTAAQFADSDKVEVGEWAIAVGSPLGLEQTVTTGVVSAVGRSGIGAATIEDFIQTDASINPGNSGGPLVNLEGKVIGINTLIYNAPGSGIGFSIPSNLVAKVSQQIQNTGQVTRPYLGITMQPITEELANHYSLKNLDGVVILDIKSNSPADKAGLKAMDIITEFDNKPIKTTSELQKLVIQSEVNKIVNLKVLRKGETEFLKIKLEQMPQSFGLSESELAELPSRKSVNEIDSLGLSVKTFTPEMASKMRAEHREGVIVTGVKAGTKADNSGLKTGDIVLQVNGEEVKTDLDFEKAISNAKNNNGHVFLINRNGIPMFVVISDEK